MYQVNHIDRADERMPKTASVGKNLSTAHALTFAGVFLFVLILYFKPSDYIPGFPPTIPIAQWVALGTIAIFLLTQLIASSAPLETPIEAKCSFFLLIWSILTTPLAYDAQLSLDLWWEVFFKVVLIFFISINCLKNRRRISALMFLGIALGASLGYQALNAYSQGIFKTEGYRVRVEHHVFGGTNDMALHFVVYIPIALVLGFASKSIFLKVICFSASLIMILGVFVAQSRGASLGLIAILLVLVKKLGRGRQFKTLVITFALVTVLLVAAPGNYGSRMLSIFDSSLDPVGSSTARSELLIQSIWVTLRNPLGVGLGNSPFFSIGGKETHNAYTQISSELGWLALAAYILMLVKPLRRLSRLERALFGRREKRWDLYLSVGLQASLVGYMVASFFGSVAYLWYMYFPIAVAIAFEKILSLEDETETAATDELKPALA